VASVSNPYRSTSEPTYGLTQYAYDGLNRPLTVTRPDGSKVQTWYCGSGTLVTDEARKWRRSVGDSVGRLIEVDEPSSTSATATACTASGANVTTYTYDVLNDLTAVSQVSSRSGTFVYDSLSHVTSSTNPESGTITYGYDNDGNAISKTDARNITITYAFDNLNRLIGKTYSDGVTPAMSYLYDVTMTNGVTVQYPVGRLVKASTASDSEGIVNTYDPMGRIAGQWQWPPLTGDGDSSFLSYSYDAAGNMLTYTNGENVMFTQAFDGAMHITSLTSNLVDSQHPASIATVDQHFANGEPELTVFGNGLREVDLLNSRFQPCRSNLNTTASAPVSYTHCTDDLQYATLNDWLVQYNEGSGDNGDVVHFESNYGEVFNRTYTYDQVDRISSMTDSASGQQCKGLSWTYDAWGNRLTQLPTSGTCGNSSLSYAATNRISSSGYTYDAVGNLTYDGSHNYTYDAESRITQVDGGQTATYVYDAMGRRAQKVANSTTTTYLYDLSNRVVAEQTAAGWTVGYVYLRGGLVAQYKNSTTSFVSRDGLGSTRLVTSLAGGVVDSMDFLPYGEQISGDTTTTHKFTGKERDSETNNDDFGARYYSSGIGRFLSADWSAIPAPVPYANFSNPQTLNLYAIVHDNPQSFADLDGHNIGAEEEGFVGNPLTNSQFGSRLVDLLYLAGGIEESDAAEPEDQSTAYTVTILGRKVSVSITGGTADDRSAIEDRLNAAVDDINQHAGDLSASDVKTIQNIKHIDVEGGVTTGVKGRTYSLTPGYIMDPGCTTAWLASTIAHEGYHVDQIHHGEVYDKQTAPRLEHEANLFQMRVGAKFGLTPAELNYLSNDKHTSYDNNPPL
jgi:RHS repeat-associated protein